MSTGLTPNTREEMYLSAAAGETSTSDLPTPATRKEIYLNAIANNSGGGGGGTSDYSQLSNKPKINNVELNGNKSLADIGAQPTIDGSHKLSADNVDDTSTTNKFTTAAQLEEISTTKSVVADMVDGSFKNLIPVTRDDIKSYNSELPWNGYSATYHGLTYTLNADGTIRINGTIGSTREFLILSRTAERTIFSEAGEYEFYCNVPNSGQIFCGINRTIDGTGVRYGADDGEGLDFEVAQSDLNLPVGIWIGTYETGGQIDCTLKPMVCKKSVWDMSNKYEPYRPTYDNLTSQVETNQTNISSILDGTTLDSFGDVETALSGKQPTLTTAQLAAVNSGIDSTKVAQISTNENNILTLQQKSTQVLPSGGKEYLEISLVSDSTNNRGIFLLSIPYQSATYASCLYMITVGVGTGISGTGIVAYTRIDTQESPDVIAVTISADKKKLFFQVQANSWAQPVIIPMFNPENQPTITANWRDSLPT